MNGWQPPDVDSWLAKTDLRRYLAMPKYDGVRIVHDGRRVVTRQGKPVPNMMLRYHLDHNMPPHTEGEFVCGDYHETCSVFNTVGSIVPRHAAVYLFDKFDEPELSAQSRMYALTKIKLDGILRVSTFMPEVFDVVAIESVTIGLPACDGIMLKTGEYLFTRCSPNRPNLVKVKRFAECVVDVISAVSLVSETGKVAQMGAVIVNHPDFGQFKVGTGFDDQQRLDGIQSSKMLVKYLSAGTKDKPRHPVFVKWM